MLLILLTYFVLATTVVQSQTTIPPAACKSLRVLIINVHHSTCTHTSFSERRKKNAPIFLRPSLTVFCIRPFWTILYYHFTSPGFEPGIKNHRSTRTKSIVLPLRQPCSRLLRSAISACRRCTPRISISFCLLQKPVKVCKLATHVPT